MRSFGRALPLLLFVLAACTSTPDDASTPPRADAGTASEEPPAPMGHTGVLSEEEFVALHEHTDRAAPALRGRTIELGSTQAYLSMPDDAEGPVPGVIVIHEWWGLNDHIRHWADRIAGEGYATLAVDLYGGRSTTNRDEALQLVQSVDEDIARELLLQAHAYLARELRAPRTGAVGWCFGGGWSLELAMSDPELDACVLYYGRLVTDPARLEPIQAEVLGIFGSQDKGIPPDAVADFDDALTGAGKEHTIRNYKADHAFANPSSARYQPEAAAAAWDEVRAFLARTLRDTP